jgi:flagellar FliJ protein
MKKSQRLSPVIKVAKDREQKAAKAMGESRRTLERHRNKLAELLVYQQEYVQRYVDAGRSGIAISRLNEYRDFLCRLNEAIASQKEVIRSRQSDLEKKDLAWRQTRVTHKSVDKILSRIRARERNATDSREQAASDDRAQHIKSGKD